MTLAVKDELGTPVPNAKIEIDGRGTYNNNQQLAFTTGTSVTYRAVIMADAVPTSIPIYGTDITTTITQTGDLTAQARHIWFIMADEGMVAVDNALISLKDNTDTRLSWLENDETLILPLGASVTYTPLSDFGSARYIFGRVLYHS